MKRMFSIIMVAILIFACASVTTYADSNSKIESGLLDVLESIDDSYKLQVFVFLYDVVDESEVVRLTYEQCGLTKESAKTHEEVDLYQKTYRNIKAEMYEAHNKVVFEKMNIADEDVMFFSRLTPSFILKATKPKVYELALLDEVASIGLYKYPLFPQPDHLFEKRFLELYENSIYTDTHYYDELYYHYDENGEIDWALIEQCSYNAPPWECHCVFKGRIFMYGDHYPISFGYGIYDVKEDKFYDIVNNNFDYSKYDDLEEVFESINPGYLIGDADRDGKLSVMDATLIQKCVAMLDSIEDKEFLDYYVDNPSGNSVFPRYIFSDFDCDGERTVMDATAIQMKLAQV